MPEPPLLYGGLVLVLGSFLSTAVGRLPRHWVVGWNVTLAGIATLAIVGVSVAYRVLLAPTAAAPPLSQFEHGVTLVSATSLIFVTLGVVQVTAGFVAAFVVPPAPFTAPGDAAAPDPRPRWMQQMAAVRAAVGDHQSHTLSSSESQLVAELAYALKRSELDVPPHLESVSAQLLDLLSRGESELDIRGAILDLLDPAIALGHRPPVPYR